MSQNRVEIQQSNPSITIASNAGLPGPVGPQGAGGEVASAGNTGGTGNTGNTGPTGPQGTTGNTGNTGADSTVAGPQGTTGNTGNTGPRGEGGTLAFLYVNGPVGASGASLEGLSLGVSGAGITLIFNGGETNAQVTFEVSATGSGSGDDVTTSTVRAAGALMDDELTSIADVKALDQSVVSGASPTFGTANFTDASNKRLMTDAQESKLDGIEASADVTDATNVTSAGALMDSELTSIADVKALNQSVVTSAHPTFAGVSAAGVSADIVDVGDVIKFTSGMTAASIVTTINGVSGDVTLVTTDQNFTDDDHTKLDGIEASADVTDATNVASAGALMDSELASIADVKALDQSVVSGASPTFAATNFTGITHTDENFTAADHTKLNGIEASADVTDATNVVAAGALMDSELASIADVKALDQSVVSGASPTFGTANFTDASNKRLMTDAQESKLDGVEASADVTDATNVAAAGALMDSELTSIADVKALNQSVVTTAHPTFAGVSAAGVSADIVDVGDQIKFTSGMTAASIVTTVNGVSGDVTISSGGASNNLGIGFVIDGDSAPISTGDKLDGARLINTDSKVISHQVYLQDGITSSNGGTLEVALRKTSTLFGSDSTVTGSAVYMNISGSGVTTHTISTPSAGATYGTLLAPSTANGATVDAAEWVYPYVTTNTANVDKIQIFIRMEDT